MEGNLGTEPVYELVMTLHKSQATGRLTINDDVGPNHMFFMQGRPVGVALAEYIHPLGQLLLEVGRINGATFVRAQRLIAEGNRLAGQVFKELGVLDDQGLRDVLALQVRKKAEHLCRVSSRTFSFCSGLTYLMGFTSTPLDVWVVVYLGVRAQLSPEARTAWIDALRDHQVRIVNAPGDPIGLPTSLSAYGFGAAEERFLQRIVGGWEKVNELCDTGTLPPEEAAVLLRYLEAIGRLEKRKAPAAVPLDASGTRRTSTGAAPDPQDEVFSSVLPRPTKPAVRAPVPDPSVFAGPNEATGPRRVPPREGRVSTPSGAPERPVGVTPEARPRFRSVPVPEPAQNAPPPPVGPPEEEFPAPLARPKKKVRRVEPLPSEGSGVLVSETRKEKTQVGPMPSIVIEEE